MPKVLIIEDDQVYRKVYLHKFEAAGFAVEIAENGTVGLERMRSFMPDIVFTDLMMPQMDGFQILDAVMADPQLKHIPMVALSNLSTPDDAEKVMQKGARALLIKSDTDPQLVVETARKILGIK